MKVSRLDPPSYASLSSTLRELLAEQLRIEQRHMLILETAGALLLLVPENVPTRDGAPLSEDRFREAVEVLNDKLPVAVTWSAALVPPDAFAPLEAAYLLGGVDAAHALLPLRRHGDA